MAQKRDVPWLGILIFIAIVAIAVTIIIRALHAVHTAT
jgi:hypothetical protein